MMGKETGASSQVLRACTVSKATMLLLCETLGRNFPLRVLTFVEALR
jgi:hypothetical protein